MALSPSLPSALIFRHALSKYMLILSLWQGKAKTFIVIKVSAFPCHHTNRLNLTNPIDLNIVFYLILYLLIFNSFIDIKIHGNPLCDGKERLRLLSLIKVSAFP